MWQIEEQLNMLMKLVYIGIILLYSLYTSLVIKIRLHRNNAHSECTRNDKILLKHTNENRLLCRILLAKCFPPGIHDRIPTELRECAQPAVGACS